MLVGSQINDFIPSLPYTKNTNGIRYREFTDYRSKKSSKELQLSSMAYWKPLEDVLGQCIKHKDNKFDYIDRIAKKKYIIADRIRYKGREFNNLDEVNIFYAKGDSVLEYGNRKKFYDWILSLKPKDVRNLKISERAKVLVTGGSGFIGRYIIKQCNEKG